MKYFIGSLILLTTLSGCASYNADTNSYSDAAAGFNRTMFNLNYYILDPYIARPAAILWRDIFPKPMRMALINVSANLTEPTSMVNYLLQGKGKKAAVHFTRFFLNTVFGLGGLIDIASMADPDLHKQPTREFGNVLGHYGVGYGPYIVLPFYGSATLRDDGGQFIDYLYPPLQLLTPPLTIARWIVDSLEKRAQFIDIEELIKQSNNPYEFMRQAYFQQHDFLAQDGKINESHQQKRLKAINNYLDEIDREE